ncbi:hypothetical protein [Fodinicola acaciae]|uniref:hypothetical protein n=1 Tax=Fodinicola acaciae TaxID=2681555 RepID=UPI0013D60FF4|nr:hypothetical protein [Fodinicola acaciae]
MAYVVIIEDVRIARAVADCLRSGLRAIADPTPVVVPAVRGAEFLRQAAENGGLGGMTLIALDDEELHGLSARAYVAVRPDGVGRPAGRYGGEVVTVAATVAEDLVEVVVAQAAAGRTVTPAARHSQRSVSTAGTLLSRIGAVWEQRNTRRVGMVVLAGALGFVGWMATEAAHPQQAQAAEIGAHHDSDDFSALGSSGGPYGLPDIGRITERLGLPAAHGKSPGHTSLANKKHHKSANQPRKGIRADYRDGRWNPSVVDERPAIPSPTDVPSVTAAPARSYDLPPLPANSLCANAQRCSGHEWYDTPAGPQHSDPAPSKPGTGSRKQEPSVVPPAPAAPSGGKGKGLLSRIGEAALDLGDAEVQGFSEFYGYVSSLKGLERDKAGPGELPKKALKSLLPEHFKIAIGILGAEFRGFLRADKDTNGFTKPFDPDNSTYRQESKDRAWGQPSLKPANPYDEPDPSYIDDLNNRLTPAPEPAPPAAPEPATPPAADNKPISQPDSPSGDSTSVTPPSATLTPPSAQLSPYPMAPPPENSPPTNGGGSSDGWADAPGGPTDASPSPGEQGPGTAPPSADAPSPPADDSVLL